MASEYTNHRPSYDRGPREMLPGRGPRGGDFAGQILDTVAPFLDKPASQWDVLDVGCICLLFCAKQGRIASGAASVIEGHWKGCGRIWSELPRPYGGS
ncbi:MAG: hypothetical protein GXY83_20265, partial [Rhodopirellula sp.]|nr:hypothetical protein [Rhodopirellula sp.]